ncbi:hypothetical protein CPB97_002871 [Podila verticillata]|nr:hypothetical protein CPB97_002871 [Podila verticillata]
MLAQCYSSSIFLQPLQLYAPVINGSQSIRIFHDGTNSGWEDCEVQRINGKIARDVIQTWADKNTGFSKDTGVRFNHAMVLQCDGQTERFPGQWEVVPLIPDLSFTDKDSFVSLCQHSHPNITTTTTTTTTTTAKKATGRALDPGLLFTMLEMLYEREYGKPDTSLKDLPDAKLWASNNTAAYQLKSLPHVGVLTEIPAIQGYLTQLAQKGVTNIILDLTGNFGGEEEFAALLPGVFFDIHGDKSIHAHRKRFRVTPAIQHLAETNLHDTAHSTFCDPTQLADLKTFTPFTIN